MIYFIQATESKHIKIGFSASNPEHRLASMQVGCPELLTLLFCIEGNQPNEKELHVKYSVQRLRGEWFKCEGALKEFVDSHTPKTEPQERRVWADEFFTSNPRYESLYEALSGIGMADDLVLQVFNETTDSYKKHYPQGLWTSTKWKTELDGAVEAVKLAYSAVQKFEVAAR